MSQFVEKEAEDSEAENSFIPASIAGFDIPIGGRRMIGSTTNFLYRVASGGNLRGRGRR